MTTNVVNVNKIVAGPRKANQCISDARRAKPAAPLFDEFWREGELALLFGAHATGKSVLAVQIADALARGTPLVGFRMPTSRHKVLYVDLDCSDAQFHMRYSRHKFPERLYRDRPPAHVDLCEWVLAAVMENGFQAVIIDSLSAIKKTHDGVRETLAAMRGLKQIRDELGILILVVSDAFEPTDGPRATVDDLRRSRVLCTVVDSVFAMGRKRWPEGGRYLEQLRTHRKIVWDYQNAPVATIKRLDSGLLGFEFDERFSPQMDEEKRRLLVQMNVLRSQGESFRSIAATLGISKSQIHSLWKKWSPLIEVLSVPGALATGCLEEDDNYEYVDEYEDAGYEKPVWLDEEGRNTTGRECARSNGQWTTDNGQCEEPEVPDPPEEFPEELSVVHSPLSIGFDGYGREIFVETRDEHTGKPTVWYQFDAKGNKLSHERGTFGITVKHLNSGPFL